MCSSRTRRLINALERPIGTPTGRNTVWHGYAPYNVAMLEKYVTIFRTVNNFVSAGDDGATPAMRLGFAQQPLGFEDILWPGQRVPRPKRARGGAGRGCWWLDGNSHLGTGTVPACRCVASPMQMDGQRVWTSTT